MEVVTSAFNKTCLAIIATVTSVGACKMFYKLYSTRKNQKKLMEKPDRPIADFSKVLFFPDKQVPCFNYLLTAKGCNRRSCLYSHDESSSFIQLIRFILDARESIDLCMFSLTCQELAEAVLIKHKLGAKVRVIADTEYMNMTGSKIPKFMAEGVTVRHDRSSYLMHHKFVVIDRAVVVTGSFNWTHAAVIGNYENIVATNISDVVQPYVTEFDRLWALFDAEGKPSREVGDSTTLLGKSDKYYVHDVE